MAKLGRKSLERLGTCHEDLQIIVHELIKVMDVSVICGVRGEQEQNKAFRDGKSNLQFPNSKHNRTPSEAVDVVPYPVDWKDIGRFERMVGAIQAIAIMKGIKIRVGADFKSFKDYPHIELVAASTAGE